MVHRHRRLVWSWQQPPENATSYCFQCAFGLMLASDRKCVNLRKDSAEALRTSLDVKKQSVNPRGTTNQDRQIAVIKTGCSVNKVLCEDSGQQETEPSF